MKINNELSLIRIDVNNLAIMRKGKAIGYYGSIEGALKAVLKHVLLGSKEEFEVSQVLLAIDDLNARISQLCFKGEIL